MPVYDSPRFNVGNPGVGSGSAESAAGARMLQAAIDSAVGIGTKAQEEGRAKNTMELLKMKKEGKEITQADYDRVGLVDSKMLETKLEKLRKYDRDVVTQDRNYALDALKTNAAIAAAKNKLDPRQKMLDKFKIDKALFKYKEDNKKDKNGKSGSAIDTILKNNNLIYDPLDSDSSTVDGSNYAEYRKILASAAAAGVPKKTLDAMVAKNSNAGNWASGFTGYDEQTLNAAQLLEDLRRAKYKI